jgi:hypothetical protein
MQEFVVLSSEPTEFLKLLRNLRHDEVVDMTVLDQAGGLLHKDNLRLLPPSDLLLVIGDALCELAGTIDPILHVGIGRQSVGDLADVGLLMDGWKDIGGWSIKKSRVRE